MDKDTVKGQPMRRMEIGIIGLGKFGMRFGTTLTELGHLVVGLDIRETIVKHASEIFARVYQGDGTDKTLLRQLRFQDLDCVAVSVGGAMEPSILASLNLSDLKVKRIIAKATSQEHRAILQRLGVHQVIQPEADVAMQTAQRISNPGMIDLLPLGRGVLVQSAVIDKWEGMALTDLNLTNKHQVMVVAVKKKEAEEYTFVPNPRDILSKGDSVVLVGSPDAILKLSP